MIYGRYTEAKKGVSLLVHPHWSTGDRLHCARDAILRGKNYDSTQHKGQNAMLQCQRTF